MNDRVAGIPAEHSRDRSSPATKYERARLTTLIAPAGFGKTTTARRLAQKWANSGYCDAFGVADIAEFARRLMGALAGQDDLAEGRLGQQVAGIGSDTARLVEAARQAWRERATPDGVIVIDHLEGLDGVDGLRELLDWLLERPHPDRSLILCSRVPLRLRFGRFALPHEVISIETDELRLDLEQIRALVPDTTSEAELHDIETVSSGWPIGILYLARAAKQQRLATVLQRLRSTSVDELEDYLTREVLARLDDSKRTVVLAAASIPNMRSGDLAILLGCTERDALRAIEATPFVDARDDGRVFEAHPLLRAIVREREASATSDILRRLAEHYSASGEGVRAAELFVAAGITREAVQALSQAISAMKSTYLFLSPTTELARTIAALTVDDLVSAPLVWNVTSLARVYGISLAQWLEESRRVTAGLDPTAPLPVRAGVVNNYANSAGMLGLFEEGREALRAFERTLAPDERPIGQLVTEIWDLVLKVWEGTSIEIDFDREQDHFAPIIATDDGTMVLWHVNVRARYARTIGDRPTEEYHLRRARAAAKRASVPLVTAVVLTDEVVSAWFWGEDARLAEAIAELEATSMVSIWDGVRHLIACCRGRGALEPVGFEQLNVRAIAFLIAAASAERASEALAFAQQAVEAADTAASRFHRVISRVGLALLSSGESRSRFFAEASKLAAETGSPRLIAAVESIAGGQAEAGMLASFAGRFSSRASGKIEINLFQCAVLRDGKRVKMQRREFDVLAALALKRGGLSREWFADRFWPDSETPEGLGRLKVYVYRLRQKLGDNAIVSTPQGYVLSSNVSVDLARLEDVLGSARLSKELNAGQMSVLEEATRNALAELQSSAGTSPSLSDALPRIESVIREAGIVLARDSLARSDWQSAAAHARRVFHRDPSDEVSAELLIRALSTAGDKIGAARIFHEHDVAVTSEFGFRAAERLRKLSQ